MLIKRIVTGIIGIITTVYIVNYGGPIFSGAVMLCAMIGWHELCKAFKHIDTKLWYGFGMITVAFVLGCAWIGNSRETIAVITIATLMVFAKVVLDHKKFTIHSAAMTVSGILYIGLSFAHLILLRFTDTTIMLETNFGTISAGCALIWVAFIGTWASDTFAFFVGSKLGKHKLCPNISPGKTVEGFTGGMIGTVLALVGLAYLFHFSIVHMVILGILIAGVATIGDLVESSFKRLTGIKDSGQILPGHGGVLDRFDSIMFTVPLVYYYIHIFKLY
ncbi:MAG: phosphatidate cytidylyltransferase [Massilibacillus sp.]|nr:phosphatidate cytidylyltransferase [Massilibacillus sp.]